jgi:hypothetical protein
LSSQETDARTTRTEVSTSIDCDPALSGSFKFLFYSVLLCFFVLLASELISSSAFLQFLAFRFHRAFPLSALLDLSRSFQCFVRSDLVFVFPGFRRRSDSTDCIGALFPLPNRRFGRPSEMAKSSTREKTATWPTPKERRLLAVVDLA